MEYFDVLNKNGNKTGLKKSRVEVHKDGDWHRAVHVWIVTSKGKLLIQKRSPIKDSHPNMWDISSAGHVLAGSNDITTAIKEIKEEIGLSLTKDDFEYLFTCKNQKVLNNGAFINNEIDDVYLVHLDLDLSKLKLQEDEVSEVKLIHYKDLESEINEKDKKFVPHEKEYAELFKKLNKLFG